MSSCPRESLVFYAVIALATAAVAAGVWFVSTPRKALSVGASTRTESEQALAVEAWAGTDSPQVLVANRSSSPVHDVRAFVALGRARRAVSVGWIRTLPPTGDDPARIALTADSRESWLRWRDKRSRDPLDVAVEVTFRDDAGRHWRRDRSGVVKAVKS